MGGERRDPLTSFYLATVDLNLDGTLNLQSETSTYFDTEAGAIMWLKEQGGCEGYVYRLEPVASWMRGPFKLKRHALAAAKGERV